MKKIITLLLILSISNNAISQIIVEIKDSKLHIDDETNADKSQVLLKSSTGDIEFKFGQFETQCKTDITEKLIGEIYYVMSCQENKITFYAKSDKGTKMDIFYCKTENMFSRKKDCKGSSESNPKVKPKFLKISQIPYPNIQKYDDEKLFNVRSNRYLVIDASSNPNQKANNTLYRPKDIEKFGDTENIVDNIKPPSKLPVNGSLAIFIRDYNFHDLKVVSIEITGSDYQYNYSIKDILNGLEVKKPAESSDSSNSGENATATASRKNEITNDLSNVLTKFKRFKYLNINDLYKIEEYKKKIYDFYQANFSDFDKDQIDVLSEVISWYPHFLSITPIAYNIPEKDEVTVKMSINTKDEVVPSLMEVGVFKTTGGIGFNLGAMYYSANLKNNQIYTKPSETTGKVRAYIDSENNKSQGLGLNCEIYFRTGYLLKPTINGGFFLPFDEEITPFGVIGPGFCLSAKNIHFSISWGLVAGKINQIKKQYRDVEFDTEGLTNEQLGEKVWKYGNYFGVGISYNLSSNK